MTDAGLEHWFDDHGAALRRLARSIVRDADRADDVVQATFLRALTAGRRPVGALRAWLAAILRNEARRAHRDEVRRARREAAAARPEATRGADREVDRLALLRALLDALGELPSEQREAVTLRHLEGLPLRAVAARQGVPVRTAETRIRRGLERLRARLDGRFGARGAWVPFLAPWAAGVWTTGLAAGLCVMKGKIAIAAAVLCAVWFGWPRSDGPAVPAAVSGAGGATVETATVDPRPTATSGAPDALRTEVTADPRSRLATVRGRIVDAGGRPIAGVRVTVRARARTDDVARWLLDRGLLSWVDPAPATTGGDGTYAVRFDPPPTGYWWSTDAAGYARLSADLGALAPGADRDLGDAVLVAGADLSGIVVDEDGVPQEGVRFMVMAASVDRALEEPFTAGGGFNPVTLADGRFTTPGRWTPGRYRIELPGFRVLQPTEPVKVDAPATAVRVVVARVDPASVITGRAVDDAGRPLSGVRCEAHSGGPGASVETYPDGRFRFAREAGDPRPATRARFSRSGFADVEVELAWGTRDARVVLARGDVLLVHVTADDGAAVERFGVRLAALPVPDRIPPRPPQLESFGAHRDGVLEVSGLTGEQRLLRVEPLPGDGHLASAFVDLGEGSGGRRDVAVVLRAPRARTVRLVDPAGAPVAGAALQLLEAVPGMPVDLETRAVDPIRFSSNSSMTWAIEVQQARTDARGEVTLVGPGDRALALRHLGPQAVPFVQRGVRLDDPTPLVVTAMGGARVEGRLGPPELIEDLREQAGLPREGPVEDALRERLPAVLLIRTTAGRRAQHPPVGDGIELGPDARFAIDGVPPGDWELALRVTTDTGYGLASSPETVATLVGLSPGETRAVDVDRPERRPALVRAHVVVDDGATTAASVAFHAAGTTFGVGPTARPDADGVVHVWLRAGAWEAWADVRGTPRAFFSAALEPAFVVGPGARTGVELRTRTGAVPLRVVAADGTSAVGVTLRAADRPSAIAADPTGADGRTVVHAGVGAFELLVRVRSLTTESAWRAFCIEHRGDEATLAGAWVPAGTVVVPVGRGAETELRLPSDWAER